MPPPNKKRCDYPGCTSGIPNDDGPTPFETSDDNTARAEVTEELKNHIEVANLLPIKLEEQKAKTAEANAKSREADAKVIEAEAKKIHEHTQ